jgi:hypothetical protein
MAPPPKAIRYTGKNRSAILSPIPTRMTMARRPIMLLLSPRNSTMGLILLMYVYAAPVLLGCTLLDRRCVRQKARCPFCATFAKANPSGLWSQGLGTSFRVSQDSFLTSTGCLPLGFMISSHGALFVVGADLRVCPIRACSWRRSRSLDNLPDLGQFGSQWVACLRTLGGERVASDLFKEAIGLV